MAVATARRGMPQQRAKTPFRYGTRQRFAPVPIQSGSAYASAGTFSAELPRVGFLSLIIVQLSGTMTLSAAGVLSARGPWDLINELVVRINIGAAVLYRTTGYGNFSVQRVLGDPFDITLANPAGTPDADLYAAPVASGGNAWVLTYWIPISANYGTAFDVGLINLQAPEVQVNLEGRYGAPSDVVTNSTSFAGTLAAGMLFYEVPNPNDVLFPPLVFHRIIESRQQITAVGDQVFTSPREGLLYRIIHLVQINDARSNGVSRFSLKFNKTDEVYRLDRWQLKFLQQYWFAFPLPVGHFIWDFWQAEGAPAMGDNRDMVSSESLSTLESIVTTTAATGGALNAFDTTREFSQVVAL